MDNTKQCSCQCSDCGAEPHYAINKKIIIISWQRLISDGSTCPRCGSTEEELDKAVIELRNSLNPLGIEIILNKSELTLAEFKKDSVKSNRIMFNDCPLEDLINAKTGQSQCCDVCGDNKCRTVDIEGESFETIPASLIVKAGLLAFAKIN